MQPPPPPSANARDPLLGTTVGSFRLVKRIGNGGMGSVYLGEQTLIGSKVAVKLLHEHLASDASLVARFYAEARAVNLIGHPNIVNIFDMNVVPPRRYYLIMEYLEGQPLSTAAAGAMAAEAAIPVLTQVCRGLQSAHARGVVHRDLKPENIFLCHREGPVPFVKILDFGIAKLFGGEMQAGQTSAGWIVGTPEYMAPEQASGETLDGRADIYALGVIAYRLATGKLPFSGGGVTGVLLAHRDRPPEPPRRLNPSVPEAWSDAILKALAKRREDRFQTADAFRAALEAVLGPAHSHPGAAGSTLLFPGPSPASPAEPAAVSPRPRAEPPPGTRLPTPVAPHPVRPAPETFTGTLVLPGKSTRPVEVRDLSRGGMFVCLEDELPPVFSRLQVSLQSPPGDLLAAAEVVRQVPAAQARAWGMSPGIGVQFLQPSEAFREAVRRRLKGLEPVQRGAGTPAPERLDTPAEKVLGKIRSRLEADPYTRLGLSSDAEFSDIRLRGRDLKEELNGLRTRPLAASQRAALERALARISDALEAVSTPARRAETDAAAGNHQGVARCIAAGLTVTELERRRRAFLATRPGAEARAQIHLVSGGAWESKGHLAEALQEYERGLEFDPLNLRLQQRYSALRKRG